MDTEETTQVTDVKDNQENVETVEKDVQDDKKSTLPRRRIGPPRFRDLSRGNTCFSHVVSLSLSPRLRFFPLFISVYFFRFCFDTAHHTHLLHASLALFVIFFAPPSLIVWQAMRVCVCAYRVVACLFHDFSKKRPR